MDHEKHLGQLGNRHTKLNKQLDELRAEIKPAIIDAAEAGFPQVRIAALTGYTRESVRKICLAPEQAETEEQARRVRRRKK